MKKILFSLIIIVALFCNMNIAEAQYAHPATAIKSTNGNVQSDLNTLQSNIGASTVEVGLITAEIALIQANLSTMEASLIALALNDATQESEIANITAEIDLIQTNLGTLEDLVDSNHAWTTAEIADITAEIALIQANLGTIETRLDEHYANLETHELSINALITNDQTQETRIESTEVGLAIHENNVSNPHSVTATQVPYTDTYLMGVTTVQSALDTIELWLSSINVTNDSQDVAISNINSDVDSAEVAINLNNIDDDSQDVQIESNRVAITLKADSDEIHTDISQAYVNVKEFGAVGDGIVDDAAAINAAIASLTSGGVVLFPSGYYCIKSQITLTGKHGITLKGVGHGNNTTYLGTNIYATGFNGYHFRGIDCVGVSIENMNLTAEGQDSSFAVGGIYFSISSNSNNPYHTFKNLFISDISNNGISIGTPIMTNFTNVTVRKCVGSSFNLWSGTSTSWTNCYANNATEAGWLLTGMTYCTLQGCAAESAGVGYYFDNSKSISVVGCGTEAIINRGGAFNGYAYRSINGSNAITLYDCYDRISETGTFSESAGGLLDYINHKTDSNAQITKIHSLPASSSVYTDTYNMGATNLQTVLDTVAVWLNSAELRLDSLETVFVGGQTGEVLTRTNDGFRWAAPSVGVIDHLLLSNIGTKTHVQLELDIDSIEALLLTSGYFYTAAEVNNLLGAIQDTAIISDTSFFTKVTGSTVHGALASIDGMQMITEYLNQKITIADTFVSIYTDGMNTQECQIFLDGVLQRPGFDYAFDLDPDTFLNMVSFLKDIDNDSLVSMTSLRSSYFNYSSIDSNTHMKIDGYTGTTNIFSGLIVPATIENLLVSEIGYMALGNANIGLLTLSEGLLTIAQQAFYGSSIVTINIPASVTSIHEQAFEGCTLLETITVEDGNTIYADLDNILYSYDMLTVLAVPVATSWGYTPIEIITTIGNYALKDTLIDSLTIPASVTSIGNYAISGCYSLTSIDIPAAVTTIGEYAFYMTPLTDVTLNTGSVEIKAGAFSSCSLLDLEIPNTITTIGDYAFYGNSSLTSATFNGDAPTTFGTEVFGECGAGFKIYYPSGASGWTNPWNGYDTEAY